LALSDAQSAQEPPDHGAAAPPKPIKDESGMPALSPPKNSGFKFKALSKIAQVTRQRPAHGLNRLLKVIYSRLLLWFYHIDRRQNDHLAVTIQYGSRSLINIDTASFIEWVLFFYGEYEPGLTDLVRRICKPGYVTCDVGANIGTLTLIMGELVGEAGKVIAVEPQPEEYEKLVENISLNRMTQVKPLCCALSNSSGRLRLYSPSLKDANRAKSSLYAANVGEGATEVPVEVTTLDALLVAEHCDQLDLLKIDTEGNEWKVLLGAQNSIKQYRPYVIFEYDRRTWHNAGAEFGSAQQFFADLGYSLYVIQDEGWLTRIQHGLPESANLLAVPLPKRTV
jgi:FkbM family methyltransferase